MFINLSNNLVLVGKLPGFQFGIDEVSVDRQLEAASARWLQFKSLKPLLVLSQNLGRQTDGLGLVVSFGAVTQTDFHRLAPVEYAGGSFIDPFILPTLPRNRKDGHFS